MTKQQAAQDNSPGHGEAMRKQFHQFTRTLASQFPCEDLRFNWKCGGSTVRLLLPAHEHAVREFDLASDPHALVVEATFAIKEILKAFDA